MELIRKKDHKLMFTYSVGSGTEKTESGERITYRFKATQHYAPIIEFPDGDIVIFNWDDIVKIAKKYKESEGQNGSNKDTNN